MREPYPLPMRLTVHHPKVNVPVLWWRSVGSTHTAFVMETLIDEIARASGQDPVAYRLSLLAPDARLARVLRRVAEMAEWQGRTRADRGYGVAVAECFGSYVAEIAEVSLDARGRPVVHQVWCALDCALPVNPGSVETQAQGGIYFGLSAALYGQISFEDGRFVQSNFHNYRVATFRDAPRVHVDVLRTPDAPMGGVGEVSTPAIAPAVANAVAALTERPRSLPLIG